MAYNCPIYILLDKVPLKELENDNALLFYKSPTRKFGTFKVIGIDEAKKTTV